MKTGFLTYCIIVIIALFFWQCKTNTIKLVKKPPFTVVKATVNDWFGGQKGVKGTKIEFHIQNASKLVFKKVYIENNLVKLFKRTNSNQTIIYTANLNKSDIDFNLHHNPKKEYGNIVPRAEVNFPFKLEKDQCVITYLKNNKEHFYKIKLKRVEAVYMP